MKNYSAEIAKAIRIYLEKYEINPILYKEANGNIDFLYEYERCKHLRYVRVSVNINPNDFHVYVYYPFLIYFTSRRALEFFSEYLFQTNKKVSIMRQKDEKVGTFVPNYSKGYLFYMYIEDCNGIVPAQKTIDRCIMNAIELTDLYASGFMHVLYQLEYAKTVQKRCEDVSNTPV